MVRVQERVKEWEIVEEWGIMEKWEILEDRGMVEINAAKERQGKYRGASISKGPSSRTCRGTGKS